MTIIEILQEAAAPERTPEGGREALKAYLVYEEQVQEAFGTKFVNEMTSAADALHQDELSGAYEQGFLNAFQLWLEVFSKYSSYPHR